MLHRNKTKTGVQRRTFNHSDGFFEETVTGRSPSLLKTDERNEIHAVTVGIKATWKVIF